MDTPESIRLAYSPPENETPEQRRKRLASKRAAKYRLLLKTDSQRRDQHRERQRKWRETLDDTKAELIRQQNRLRQKARRTRLTADDKVLRNERQRHRRAHMDGHALAELRERERLRAQQRRSKSRQSMNSDGVSSSSETSSNEARLRLPSSPAVVPGRMIPATTLPPASLVLGGSIGSRVAELLEQLPSATISRSQFHPQPHNQHPPIEIAPLQFVLPPASSIQSLTLADRMAPLPQVQNVLPHASTLFNTAVQSLPVSASVAHAVSTSTSALGPLLNPQPLPSLPQASSLPPPPVPGVLPSLSQLPDLFTTTASARDFFDGVSASATTFFPSIADFTGDL